MRSGWTPCRRGVACVEPVGFSPKRISKHRSTRVIGMSIGVRWPVSIRRRPNVDRRSGRGGASGRTITFMLENQCLPRYAPSVVRRRIFLFSLASSKRCIAGRVIMRSEDWAESLRNLDAFVCL